MLHCRVVLSGLSLLHSSSFAIAFATGLLGTSKFFAMAACGYVFVKRNWINASGLQTLGQLVGLLTLPALIFYRMATRFDPATLPDWWKYVLGGALVTLVGLPLGKLVAWRNGGNDEATLLVGFQNAGFFVLPMLQTLLSPPEYERTSLLLFMVFIPFNACLWFASSWFLLKKKSFSLRTLLTPTFCATVGSLLLYGLCHDALHHFDGTFVVRVLLGDETNRSGILQQIGDTTVPLATFTLGGSVAAALLNPTTPQGYLATEPQLALPLAPPTTYARAAAEVALVKTLVMPLIGLIITPLLLYWLGRRGDHAVSLLFTLEWAAPPASALSIFAQQHRYRMTMIPLACLLGYALCVITVPFWVALAPS